MSQDHRQHTAPTAGRDNEARRARLAALRSVDARRARRGKRLRTGAMLGGVLAVVAVVLMVVTALHGRPADDRAGDSDVDPDKANVQGEKVYRDLDRGHVTGGIDYPDGPNPPVGGQHNPKWQNANGDVYTQPLRNEHAVHSLEHGAVWATYSKSAPSALIEALRTKVEGVPYRMMSPLPDQDSPVRLTAWGHQLSVDSATDPRVDAFFNAYVQGPQAPEPGAPVTGGRATP
ncbi:DUF3105 domain-containing protein [Streptomyces sp. 7N604]|uniref:DUF3105 domain-containing protein n=1 Tax=Streptomyces sp. 7N604 TaxID=3457415 RepID=UPI003FD49335